MASPINDSVGMEIFQGKKHFGCVELGLTERKLPTLNMQHEITSTDVFHDEIDTGLSLETRMKTKKERMTFACGSKEYTLLGTRTA